MSSFTERGQGLHNFLHFLGDKENQIHMEGYQVSAQCMALVRDNCLLPTKDAPELGYVRESTDKQYVPDVFYKVSQRTNLSLFSFIILHSITSLSEDFSVCLQLNFSFVVGWRRQSFLLVSVSSRRGEKLLHREKFVFQPDINLHFFGFSLESFFSLFFNNRIEKLRAAVHNRA